MWSRDAEGQLRFHRVRPTRTDLEVLVQRIADRCERWLDAQGDDEPDPDDAQAVLLAASAAGRVAAGGRAGQSVRRFGVLPASSGEDAGGRGVNAAGYSLHAGTFVAADDRPGLEHLARYLLRPPLSKARLEERPGTARSCSTCASPGETGTTAFLFTPLELVEKLAALVIRPRVHTVHVHGVYAARSGWRAEVVSGRGEDAERGRDGKTRRTHAGAPPASSGEAEVVALVPVVRPARACLRDWRLVLPEVEGGVDRLVQLGERYFLVELRLGQDEVDVSKLTEAEARLLASAGGTTDFPAVA